MSINGALRRKAIDAAKTANWQLAVELNQQILSQYPEDVSALNRLGVAYVQLKNIKKATKAFKDVLKLDKTNIIAKKHLSKIEKNQDLSAPSFTQQHFIEEPGKTKIIELRRLANKQTLEKLHVGAPCELKLKNRYISIEVNGNYVGALPEDVSFRLGKLIQGGNQYNCSIRSSNGKNCSVYIKETYRSSKNFGIQSFPSNKGAMSQLDDVDESYLLKEEIPIEIVETDRDVEKSFDDVDSSSFED